MITCKCTEAGQAKEQVATSSWVGLTVQGHGGGGAGGQGSDLGAALQRELFPKVHEDGS